MTDKQVVITAVFFVFAYIITLFFIFRYLYTAKTHIQKLHEKTAMLHNQMRDTQAMTAETQQDLHIVKTRITPNY
jgi:capsular polysaccharide biosynthesis protein